MCLQGVWFISSTPQGPWTTASSIPQVIYTIPPSSPVYNVTYVTQVTTSSGYVQSSYTAGYVGAFVMGVGVGAIVASGTGYYYPPYIGYPLGGYPVYHPYPTPYGAYGATPYYNSATGAYGVSQAARMGPMVQRTALLPTIPTPVPLREPRPVATPYGKQSVGQAYNPYTGTYGATHQGSSPTAQWGQSYVSQGNKSATTQHYSTANGTAASAKGSQGGQAYGTSTAHGSTYAGKSSSGDVYAGHDGNVYQHSSSGWQQYDNGSWNSVNSQQAKQNYNQEHPNSQATAQPGQIELRTATPQQSGHCAAGQSGISIRIVRLVGSPLQSLDSERRSQESGSTQSHPLSAVRIWKQRRRIWRRQANVVGAEAAKGAGGSFQLFGALLCVRSMLSCDAPARQTRLARVGETSGIFTTATLTLGRSIGLEKYRRLWQDSQRRHAGLFICFGPPELTGKTNPSSSLAAGLLRRRSTRCAGLQRRLSASTSAPLVCVVRTNSNKSTASVISSCTNCLSNEQSI